MDDLEKARRALQAGPPLSLAVLFGSRATGRARPDSDVDIAIVPADASLALGLELALAARLSSALAREVDLVRLDRASTLLRWQIARDGILLLAEPGWEWVRFRARAASEYADIADSLERAAKLFRRRIAGSIA